MNQLPLRREAMLPRIDGIQKNLIRLQEFSRLPFEEFSKEEVLDRVQHHLRLALEGVFNIASHILSRVPGGRASEYKEMAKRLGEFGLVDRKFAEHELVKMAGYRNRLTHYYAQVKTQELYDICRSDLGDIDKFLGYIKEILDQPGKFKLRFE